MTKNVQRPRVLVSDYRQPDISAEIPYLFHRAGCIVEVYCAAGSWLRKNRHHDAWHPADVSTRESYVAGLSECLRRQQYDQVVLTEDEAVRAVVDAASSGALPAYFSERMSAEGKILGVSKAELSRACHRHGVVTPRFAIYAPDMSAEDIGRVVGFPLVAKVDRSSGGAGVFLCPSFDDLTRTIADLPESKRQNLVLQEYIQGANLSCEALFKSSELLASAGSRVAMTTDGEFSVSSGRVYQRDIRMEQLLSQIGRLFALDGFYNMTFMESAADGTLYLIEADSRPNIWFVLTRFAGVDFSLAIGRYLGLEPPGPFLSAFEHPTPLRHFHRDVDRALAAGDLAALLFWLTDRDGCWRFVPFYDRSLFKNSIVFLWRNLCSRLGDRYPQMRKMKRRLSALKSDLFPISG